MKITQQHFDHIKSSISAIWTQEKHDCHRQFILNEGKAKDVEKRLRHDWIYYAGLSAWICDNLYGYMNDTHIDTALRNVMIDLQA